MGPLLADSFDAEEDSPSNVQAVLVDDMHKTALVWKHVSTGVFGDKGGIGDDHHYQVLYTLYCIFVKDLHNARAQARKWMHGNGGIWCRQPPVPTETRWEYTGNAANFTLEVLVALLVARSRHVPVSSWCGARARTCSSPWVLVVAMCSCHSGVLVPRTCSLVEHGKAPLVFVAVLLRVLVPLSGLNRSREGAFKGRAGRSLVMRAASVIQTTPRASSAGCR